MDDKPLKQSDAPFVGGTNGTKVNRSDLERGYSDAEVQPEPDFGVAMPEPSQGFLNRPRGWER